MEFVMTKELAQILEKAESDVLYSRLTGIKEIQGNPMGVEVQEFGNAIAFTAKNIPGPSFNTVKGITDDDIPYIEEIIGFYKQKGIPARFELTPGHVSSELLSLLHDKGYYQTSFHTTLYSPLSKELATTSNKSIHIRRLEESEFDMFANIYCKGFQMPSFLKDGVAQNNRVLYGSKNWTFFIASFQGELAGIGVLFCKDQIATLAAATTLPEYRKKGIQTALINQRLQQALLHNCNLVVGQAQFGSVSQNNMERTGMKIAFTKAIWAMK